MLRDGVLAVRGGDNRAGELRGADGGLDTGSHVPRTRRPRGPHEVRPHQGTRLCWYAMYHLLAILCLSLVNPPTYSGRYWNFLIKILKTLELIVTPLVPSSDGQVL